MEHAPTIDLSPAFSGSLSDRMEVAMQIDSACRSTGFFVAVGHGVEETLLEDVIDTSREFFNLPVSEKIKVAPPGPNHFRGYLGLDTTALASTLEIETPPDLCESFNVSRFDDPEIRSKVEQLGAEAVFCENMWPENPHTLKKAYETYFAAMEHLCSEILKLMAIALELPEEWFDDKFEEPTSLLMANWYPPVVGKVPAGQLRRGEHTDYGAFTIVAPEQIPGLQISVNNQWVDVGLVENGYVINIGDLLARWTNDRWTSTLHRVVLPEDPDHRERDRISIPFFFQPTYTAEIETIPTTIDENKESSYEPVISGEWITAKSMSMLE
ncbi:MAG: hypothetical protein CL440_03770 [Acidimicrobiaceae bacterium]|nr:hypothetical protein [Acidimicrobiaceae bacterium]